jgi:hypothetical protein
MTTDLPPEKTVALAKNATLVEAADRACQRGHQGEAAVSRVPEPQAVVDGLMKR